MEIRANRLCYKEIGRKKSWNVGTSNIQGKRTEENTAGDNEKRAEKNNLELH